MGLTELVSAGDSRTRVKTLERSGLSIAVYGGTVLVDETKVLEWGKNAQNGVIHVIDGLLQPQLDDDFQPFAEIDEEGEEGGKGVSVAGVTAPLYFWDPLGLGGGGREEGKR